MLISSISYHVTIVYGTFLSTVYLFALTYLYNIMIIGMYSIEQVWNLSHLSLTFQAPPPSFCDWLPCQ